MQNFAAMKLVLTVLLGYWLKRVKNHFFQIFKIFIVPERLLGYLEYMVLLLSNLFLGQYLDVLFVVSHAKGSANETQATSLNQIFEVGSRSSNAP